MKTTLLLSKIYLKELTGSFFSKNESASAERKGGSKIKWALLILLPVLFYPQIFVLSLYLYGGFAELGLHRTAFSVATLVAVLFNFMTIFSAVISNLGGDKTLIQLMTLPVRSRQIFSAKMLLFYFLTVFETLYLLSPTLILYAMDFGFQTLLFSVPMSVMLPIVPMCIALLVIMPFAKAFSRSRLKKFVPYFLNILFFFAYLGVIGSTAQVQNLDFSAGIVEAIHQFIGRIYPLALWGGLAVQGDFLYGLLYLAVNMLFVALVHLASGYFAKVMLSETHYEGEKPGSVKVQSSSVFSRLMHRQIGILFSSHRFVLQGLGSLITAPLLIAFYIYAGMFDFDTLYQFVHSHRLGLIFTFFLVFGPTVTSSISVTSVAREGGTFWQNKVLPISAKTQVLARLYFSLLLNLPFGIVTALVLGVMLDISSVEMIAGIASGIGYVLFFSCVDHVIDAKYPNLGWTNEAQAIKTSKAITISMFFKLFTGAALVFGIYFASKYFSLTAITWISLLLGVVLGVCGLYLLMRQGVALYRKIDA